MTSLLRLFVVVGSLCLAVQGILEDGVLVVKESNIENHIAKHYEDGMFLYYYAAYCEACVDFGQEYASAAQALANEGITFAKIDAAENQALIKEHNVQSLPHVRWLRRGRMVDATSGVVEAGSADAIADIVRRLRRDRLTRLETKEELLNTVLENGIIKKGVRAILLSKSKGQRSSFAKLADEFRYPVEFFLGSQVEWLQDKQFFQFAEEINEISNSKSVVVLFKHFDEQIEITPLQAYSKSKAKEQRQWLSKWIETRMMPLLVPFAPQYMDMIFQGPLQVHAILAIREPPLNTQSSDLAMNHVQTKIQDIARDAFSASAKKYRGKILHIIISQPNDEDIDDDNDETNQVHQQHQAIWNFLNVSDPPQIIISDMFDASESNPQGTQYQLSKEAATNADILIEELVPHAARAVARRAGVEPKMSEIMSEPKMQETIRDPDMVPNVPNDGYA